MQQLFPDNSLLCLPILIGNGSSEEGPRLGGTAPEGILPREPSSATQILVTIPMSQNGEECSVFLSFDFDEMANASCQFQAAGSSLIDVVFHGKSKRASQFRFASELTAHPLLIQTEAPDWIVSGGGKIVESGHKLGGRPYLEQPKQSLLDSLDEVLNEGFRQFLQLGFPSGREDALVAGNWPFADGMFHLFIRPNGTSFEWRCFWEY